MVAADPGHYTPKALGVTFPFTITEGMPFSFMILQSTIQVGYLRGIPTLVSSP